MAYGDWKGVGMRIPGGKGSIQRKTDQDKFAEGYDRIFRKKYKEEIAVVLDELEQEALEQEQNESEHGYTGRTKSEA